MAKSINNERHNKIIQHVIQNGRVKVSELADIFDVSTETIRKDLSYLHKNKVLSKEHGAVTVTSAFLENEFTIKNQELLEEKSLIAQRAATQIPNGSVIFLDSGTTALQLGRILNLRNDLTIISNSAILPQYLSSGNKVLITGGELRGTSFSFVGSWTLNAIKQIKTDVAFLSCSGFHENGPSIHSYRELEVKQAIIDGAKKVILMANTQKIQTESLYKYADFSAFDMLITERKLTENERTKFPSSLHIMDY